MSWIDAFFTTIYQQIKRKLFGSKAPTTKEQISKISTISISFPESKISILDVSKQKQQDTQKTETIPTTSTVKNTYPSGYILETNAFFHFEDYTEILECANQIKNKLIDKPIYVLSKTKDEYVGKRCPKNRNELIRDNGYTGKKRDFNKTLKQLAESLGTDIHYVDVTNMSEIKELAKKSNQNLKDFGLHDADSIFLAFTKLTKSILITCDKDLIRCCNLAQCKKPIEFQGFIEKIIQPSPITVVLRKRRAYRKNLRPQKINLTKKRRRNPWIKTMKIVRNSRRY